MIGDRIRAVKALLGRVEAYDNVVRGDGFTPATIVDMKDNAKAVCDDAKSELDEIKNEIDQWT